MVVLITPLSIIMIMINTNNHHSFNIMVAYCLLEGVLNAKRGRLLFLQKQGLELGRYITRRWEVGCLNNE